MMINRYTVVDLEMTGLSAKTDHVIEIGAGKIVDGKVMDTYAVLVNPGCPVPERITELTGISTEMVAKNGISTDIAMQGLLDFIGDDILVGQNLQFDYSFIKQWAVNSKKSVDMKACDTLKIARAILPKEMPKKLENLCAYYEVSRENAHRALDDALETAQIFEHLKKDASQKVLEGTLGAEEQEALFMPKTLVYKAKKQTPATPHQIRQLKEYRAAHHITDEIYWECLTRNEASRMMDKYYVTYGRP